jgi:cobalt/nickel transport system permease protein
VKLVALVVFVLAVALVPHGVLWPYAIDLAVLAAVAHGARVEAGFLGRRLLVEIPFVLFVLVLPFVAGGPRTEVLGVALSEPGLWTAAGIACKATLAVLATGVLGATTTAPEIVTGCERLRVPRTLTAIGGFAVRYLQVVLDELRRLQLARVARGDDPRWIWQARTAAGSAGTLVVRSFERGERVHAAMLARGYEGRMPDTSLAPPARRAEWALALAPPAVAVAALLGAVG